jgi:Spy/CpxP family protein refolding chaperone
MRPGQAPGGPGPANEAFKVVDAYVLSNLQESLGLTDEQFVKLLPLVKRVQSERREFAQRRARTMMELRRLLASGAATKSRVVELLTELKTIENDEPQALRKSRDAIDAALSPLQQAKYRVLEGDVERRIRELMRELGARGPGARGQRPNNPEREPPQPPQE